jgi:GLPGLI family protein
MTTMKTKFFCVILASFLLATSSFSQNNFTILYKQGNIKNNLDEYKKPKSEIKWSGKFNVTEFTVKDSITFFETLETIEANDELNLKSLKKTRKNKVLGKAFMPNSVYCDYAKNICIEEIEWKDETYLVKDEITNRQKTWSLSEEQKLVFGYACKKAEQYGENAKLEKIIWYSENIKCNLSCDGDLQIPGVVLEMYDVKTGILTTAIDLVIETNPMMMPSKGTAITRAEFNKLAKGKR